MVERPLVRVALGHIPRCRPGNGDGGGRGDGDGSGGGGGCGGEW